MWSVGAIGIITYCVKHYDEPSRFGIDNGRISKLCLLQNGVEVACYDRGWDVMPRTQEAKRVLGILMEKYN